MKERYIELMERTLSAYTDEHIVRYFDDVKRDGLTEHGFPRLTSNIGILISHGRRTDLLPLFTEMMTFCCENIPKVKAANDFSVREIICCLQECEQNNVVDASTLNRWKELMSECDPQTCYTVIAQTPEDKVKNWALFTGVSEFFRQSYGLCDSSEFIDIQLASQLQWLDENGMYMDHPEDIHQPIVYDLVPRGLFSLLLDAGYDGKHREVIDKVLRKAALVSLEMQSPNGEIPFGGRSNQFLHNEPWLISTYEFEAKRYAKEGNMQMASRFKAAAKKALSITEYWLSKEPIYHIKNRFPTETQYGCESYAYFDKYMITTASMIYMGYQMCDDTIPANCEPDSEPSIFATSYHFHKLFMKCGGYGLEFELNADTHYEANGLGRIHRNEAPSAICLSCPFPENPGFESDIDEPQAFSLCSTAVKDGIRYFGADKESQYRIIETKKEAECAKATVECKLNNDISLTENYTVSAKGVDITLSGDGEIGYALPAFTFDGEKHPNISFDEHTLSVEYEGWICKYTSNGIISDYGKTVANRNGHYNMFIATGCNNLNLHIDILKV